ncbi:MAG: Mth938-like domain-containing protein [Betaproteobacteria bacterium]|nr:Mth938-like domain-containing protein [Betaproteobacteria bacterium]
MKLHLHTTPGTHTITAHGDGYVAVDGQRYEQPLIVLPDQLIHPWPVSALQTLTPADFAPLIELAPALVILGSGPVFRFPDPRIAVALAAAGIGFEVMDTPAACRTYNVLASEGRKVAAALLM